MKGSEPHPCHDVQIPEYQFYNDDEGTLCMKFHLSLTEVDIGKIICQHIESHYGIPAEPSDLCIDRRPEWALEFHYDSKQTRRSQPD
jgi:hypothetical protein